MKLVTEFLVIIEKDTSEAFYTLCDNVGEFNKLLQSDPEISIQKNELTYRKTSKFKYEAKTNLVKGKSQRFFHLRIEFNGEETEIDGYLALLRAVKSVIHRSGGRRETLWDDLSLHYSHKAYPLIHNVENLMRKLITFFMLTNVGTEWVTEASPNVVKEAIDKSKRKQYLDVLHQIDFSHLGDLLFKVYQTKDVAKLYESLAKATKLDELKLDELKAFVATSNWEKYFSKIVSCTDEYLNKRWKQLYEYRCMVAHNALIGKSEYESIEQLVRELEGHLQKAIDNIGKVSVPQEDREQVAEIVASNLSASYGDFIQLWKSFEVTLLEIATNWALETVHHGLPRPPIYILKLLHEKEIIDNDLFREARDLWFFRNRLIHDATTSISEQETRSYIIRLDELLKVLRQSWKDEIVSALRALGGKGSLSSIYEHIENHSVRKLPATWKATVRYTLQINSSTTETSQRGGEDLFCHLAKGQWGLKDL